MTVGELNKVTPEDMLRFVHPDRAEIDLGFNFDHVNLGLKGAGLGRHLVGEWKISELKAALSRWQRLRELAHSACHYLENHDQTRSISRFADDSPQWRWESGRVLALLMATLFGTLFMYEGQEIGMINLPNDWPLEEYKDVQTQNIIKEIQERGIDVGAVTKRWLFKARDNARSPMQWSNEPNAGFSTAKPWMRVNDDVDVCNVESQINDPTSLLSFWKDLLAWRKANEDVIIYGSFRDIDPADERVYGYVRAGAGQQLLVMLNLTGEDVEYTLPEEFGAGKLVKSTTDGFSSALGKSVKFTPYSGAVYDVGQ